MFFDTMIARSRRIIRLAVLPLAASLFFLGTSVANADGIYVQIDGVEGDSVTDLDLGGSSRPITAYSWQWGMGQTASALDGSRTGAKVNVQELSFTHVVDKATPRLMEYCAIGRPVPSAHLTLVRSGPGGEPYAYASIELQNVIVSSISTAGGGLQERPTETVSLRFAAFEFKYTPIDPRGEKFGDIKFGWSVYENKRVEL